MPSTPFIVQNQLKSIFAGREGNLRLTQQAINVKPHFVPFNIEVLAKTLGHKLIPSYSVEEFRADCIAFVTERYSHKLYSRKGKLYTNGNEVIDGSNIYIFTPAIVYSGSQIMGVLFAAKDSYSSAKAGLFAPFLNKVLNKKLSKKGTGNYGKGFDIGHTNIRLDDGRILGENVSGKEVEMVFDAISKIKPLDENQAAMITSALAKMNEAKAEFDVHATYAETIKTSFSKSFQESLLSVEANVVIIQESSENRRDYGKVEAALVKTIKNAILDIKFSRNFKEEVDARIMASLTGKKIPSTSKTVKVPDIVIGKTKKVSPTVAKVASPRIRNLETKRLIGLDRLLSILNYHLQDVLSANMGDGNEKRILNYRTGRFAASAKVERLTTSRDGLITAFYSYMKNPYATFSAGGRQQYPKTRDPKLLIGQSIRDIASRYVAEKLRTVNV